MKPADGIAEVFTLGNDAKYGKPAIYGADDRIPVTIFNGEPMVNLAEVFEKT